MSFVAAAVGVVAAGTIYQASQARQARKDAQAAAQRQEQLQREAMAAEQFERSKRGSKAPQRGAFYTNQMGGSAGPMPSAGTLLTGANGVDPGALEIGKRTLLG